MRVKRYVAPNLQSAINKVKKELGKDAVILHTKRRRKGGLFGLFGRQVIEITAATQGNGEVQPPPLPDQDRESLITLQRELKDIKTMLAGMTRKESVPKVEQAIEDKDIFRAYHLLSAYNNLLIENDVTEANAAALLKKVISILPEEGLQDHSRVRSTLLEVLTEELDNNRSISGCDSQKVVALIGPTGVGKTTTVAKLAANFALLENRDVALITADTYRIAAVEQLRRYAEIINVPLEVVLSPDEFEEAVRRHRDKGLLLIDTAGRSQRNTVQLAELRELLHCSTEIETLLVMSLTTKYRDLLEILAKFKRVDYDALLFTKLDETTSYGSIYNLIKLTGKPLTYVTTGQNVPDDIEVAQASKMAKLILGES